MSAALTLTLGFRGLMVFNFGGEENQRYLEIGFLPAQGHVLRINTIKDSKMAKPPDLLDALVNTTSRDWRLDIQGEDRGVTTRTQGETFARLTHAFAEDFRWMVDIEGDDFHGDLTGKLKTDMLKPLLRIPSGELYTIVKTPTLERKRENDAAFTEFGSLGAVVGCDIKLEGTEAKLWAGEELIFTFKSAPNTIYEIANTPLDVSPLVLASPLSPANATTHEHDHDHGSGVSPHADHFQHYYDLLEGVAGIEKVTFKKAGVIGALAAPAPDPALCGAIQTGRRTGPL